MDVTFRPLERDDFTAPAGWKRPFNSTYAQTLALLDDELRHLGADRIVIQLALDGSEIRLDGMPRARAHVRHPGVAISSEHREAGPLRYATNVYGHWHSTRWFAEQIGYSASGTGQALAVLEREGRAERLIDGKSYWRAANGKDPKQEEA